MTALTAQQITDLNNSMSANQNPTPGLGDRLNNLEIGASGLYHKVTQTVLASAFTDGGATAGTFVASTLAIPAGATVTFAAVTAVTGFAGDTTAVLQIGDGTTAARYSTGSPSIFATAANGVAVGVPSGVQYHAAAKTVTLTVTSSTDFTPLLTGGGSVTVSIYYIL